MKKQQIVKVQSQDSEIHLTLNELGPDENLNCTVMINDEALQKATELGLGLSQAKIYLTLARRGPLTVEFISKLLEMDKTDVYRAILGIQKRGLVYVGIFPPLLYPLQVRNILARSGELDREPGET